MAKHKRILPNTYVPAYSNKLLASVLGRLAKPSLCALILLWAHRQNTQPHKSDQHQQLTQAQYNELVGDAAKAMRTNKWTKLRIIDAILNEYWQKGLNLLQLAQIDCQLLVDNPNSYLWILSSIKDAWGAEAPLSVNPKHLLDSLATHLGQTFMSHIYVCTHPTFPLVIIRTQVFDLLPTSGRQLGSVKGVSRPHVSSHRPYFLAVPMNSPHLIHSPGSDLVSQTVMQAVEASLSSSPTKLVTLTTPVAQKAVKSLNAMHILKGCSRFSQSLGAWIPYADGEADVSPLAGAHNHPAMDNSKKTFASSEEHIRALARIRFRGSSSEATNPDEAFESLRPPRKRKKSEHHSDSESHLNEYSSLVPIRVAEFELQGHTEDTLASEPPHVLLKLVGTDVFAGLHELSVRQNPEKPFIDLKAIPGWLTGEEGESCGKIINGQFHKTES